MTRQEAIRLILGSYVVGRFSRIRKGLRLPPDKDLIVGMGAQVAGSIVGGANVYLARGSHVVGRVEARLDVVVGAGARVEGDVTAGANAYVLDEGHVGGRLRAGGLARIVGGFVAGPVGAAGDVEVAGRAVLHEVQAGGRIRTLAPATGFRNGDSDVTDS